MAFASVSGMVSGLDTATIISQLMQVEGQSQTLLKSRVTAEQAKVSALQGLNTKLSAAATKAQDLTQQVGWSPLTVTSSSEHVKASAGATAAPGGLSFTVDATAAAHRLTFAQTATGTTRVTGPDSTVVRLDNLDGTTLDLETGDGSLDGLVRVLNAPETGVRATKVRLDDGSYRVSVESTATGKATDFTLAGLDSAGQPTHALLGGATVAQGRDAAVTINGDTVHAASNTFSGVVAGLDFTIASATPAGTTVELTVARDAAVVTDAVKAMVDAVNAALTDIDRLTKADGTSNSKPVLAGDAILRTLRNDLIATVSNAADGRSLATVGIELDRSGRVTFDAEKFGAAYGADPVGVASHFTADATWTGSGQVTLSGASWRTQPGAHTVDSTAGTIDGRPATTTGSVLTGAVGSSAEGLSLLVTGAAVGTVTYQPGFAARVAAVAQRASDATDGTLSSAIKGRTDRVDDMQQSVQDWNVRLELRRQTLTRQFSAMEVALGQLQNQSSWLASQISSLPTQS